MKYKNVSGVPLSETFFGIGTFSMGVDEVKEIPKTIVDCWTNTTRTNGTVLLEPVKEKAEPEEAKPADEPEDVEAPDGLEFEPVEPAPTPRRRR